MSGVLNRRVTHSTCYQCLSSCCSVLALVLTGFSLLFQAAVSPTVFYDVFLSLLTLTCTLLLTLTCLLLMSTHLLLMLTHLLLMLTHLLLMLTCLLLPSTYLLLTSRYLLLTSTYLLLMLSQAAQVSQLLATSQSPAKSQEETEVSGSAQTDIFP